jgi:hypothetical protein
MKSLITVDLNAVLVDTWDTFSSELSKTPLPHFTESVFRFLFVRSLLQRYPDVRCETEWKRLDLVFFDDSGPVVVEFKFYVYNYHRDFQGASKYQKGGACEKNFDEFCRCVRSLVQLDTKAWGKDQGANIRNRYVIIAYADADGLEGINAYRTWYDQLKLPENVTQIANIRNLTRLSDLACRVTKHRMTCQMFQVLPIASENSLRW